jgi:endonuclease-8
MGVVGQLHDRPISGGRTTQVRLMRALPKDPKSAAGGASNHQHHLDGLSDRILSNFSPACVSNPRASSEALRLLVVFPAYGGFFCPAEQPMPEGDTIHKLSTFLSGALVGRRLDGARLRGRTIDALAHAYVLRVTSKGKHLFIDFEGGASLRVHLGMYGSWHRYPIGQTWQKPAHRATLVLSAAGQDYVCFNAKEVEILDTCGFRRRDQADRLGPDLSRDAPAAESLLRRARDLLSPATELVDLLLDQRVASGIGNVYKSEVLFLERCEPRTRFGDISEETFAALYRTAERLLLSNLGGGPRITRTAGDGRGILWVYGRAGQPCLRCGTSLVRERLGKHARSTYWCPGCQSGQSLEPPALHRATELILGKKSTGR